MDRREVQFIDRNAPGTLRLYDQFVWMLKMEDYSPEGVQETVVQALEMAAVSEGWTQRADGSWFCPRRLKAAP